MGTIYLIRHGEIPQATPRRFIGQRDLPLANLFRIEQNYGCLNVIETGRQGTRIKGMNCLTIP